MSPTEEFLVRALTWLQANPIAILLLAWALVCGAALAFARLFHWDYFPLVMVHVASFFLVLILVPDFVYNLENHRHAGAFMIGMSIAAYMIFIIIRLREPLQQTLYYWSYRKRRRTWDFPWPFFLRISWYGDIFAGIFGYFSDLWASHQRRVRLGQLTADEEFQKIKQQLDAQLKATKPTPVSSGKEALAAGEPTPLSKMHLD